ncbi:MAG: DUF126 domain-containing protein [Akkermansia sp.]|nr:DUF126 domain-containing protein [Akkermansia sp.]
MGKPSEICRGSGSEVVRRSVAGRVLVPANGPGSSGWSRIFLELRIDTCEPCEDNELVFMV